jgi:hypothetical protein
MFLFLVFFLAAVFNTGKAIEAEGEQIYQF